MGTDGPRPGICWIPARKDTDRLHQSPHADYRGLAIGHSTSAGEEVAKMASEARVVKAFNTSFADLMKSKSRRFGSMKATGFCCGDDIASKALVSSLVKETGLDPADAGPLSCARYLEPMAMLMMQLRFSQKIGAEIALGLLQR